MPVNDSNNRVEVRGYVDPIATIEEGGQSSTIFTDKGRLGFKDSSTVYKVNDTIVWRARFVSAQDTTLIMPQALEDGSNPDFGGYNPNQTRVRMIYVNFLGKTGVEDNEIYLDLNVNAQIGSTVRRMATLYTGESFILPIDGDLSSSGLECSKILLGCKRYDTTNIAEREDVAIELNRAKVDVVLICGPPSGSS